MYLSGESYCGPYCPAFSYVVSVGFGAFAAILVNLGLRSHFLEKCKKNWLLENQGKYYVENGTFRRVPIFAEQSLPEGLAFICSSPLFSKKGLVTTLSRIVIVTTILNTIVFLVRMVIKKIANITIKRVKESKHKKLLVVALEDESIIDGLYTITW